MYFPPAGRNPRITTVRTRKAINNAFPSRSRTRIPFTFTRPVGVATDTKVRRERRQCCLYMAVI